MKKIIKEINSSNTNEIYHFIKSDINLDKLHIEEISNTLNPLVFSKYSIDGFKNIENNFSGLVPQFMLHKIYKKIEKYNLFNFGVQLPNEQTGTEIQISLNNDKIEQLIDEENILQINKTLNSMPYEVLLFYFPSTYNENDYKLFCNLLFKISYTKLKKIIVIDYTNSISYYKDIQNNSFIKEYIYTSSTINMPLDTAYIFEDFKKLLRYVNPLDRFSMDEATFISNDDIKDIIFQEIIIEYPDTFNKKKIRENTYYEVKKNNLKLETLPELNKKNIDNFVKNYLLEKKPDQYFRCATLLKKYSIDISQILYTLSYLQYKKGDIFYNNDEIIEITSNFRKNDYANYLDKALTSFLSNRSNYYSELEEILANIPMDCDPRLVFEFKYMQIMLYLKRRLPIDNILDSISSEIFYEQKLRLEFVKLAAYKYGLYTLDKSISSIEVLEKKIGELLSEYTVLDTLSDTQYWKMKSEFLKSKYGIFLSQKIYKSHVESAYNYFKTNFADHENHYLFTCINYSANLIKHAKYEGAIKIIEECCDNLDFDIYFTKKSISLLGNYLISKLLLNLLEIDNIVNLCFKKGYHDVSKVSKLFYSNFCAFLIIQGDYSQAIEKIKDGITYLENEKRNHVYTYELFLLKMNLAVAYYFNNDSKSIEILEFLNNQFDDIFPNIILTLKDHYKNKIEILINLFSNNSLSNEAVDNFYFLSDSNSFEQPNYEKDFVFQLVSLSTFSIIFES